MPTFTMAPVEEVMPQKRRGPSARALAAQEYRNAIRESIDRAQACVVYLEEGDKPLTVRMRLKRALKAEFPETGGTDFAIRRNGDRIVVYPKYLVPSAT